MIGKYNVKIRKNNIRIKFLSPVGYKYTTIIQRKNDNTKPDINFTDGVCEIVFNDPKRNIYEVQHIRCTRRPIYIAFKDKDNQFHRDDEPAVIRNRQNGLDVVIQWYQHGILTKEEYED